MSTKTIAITREAIAENPEVIRTAMSRLARLADFHKPGPVTIETCPGHPTDILTVSSGDEHCFIHLTQEIWSGVQRG